MTNLRMLAGIMALSFATNALPAIRVEKSEHVNYDWVERELFSDDPIHLESLVRIEIKSGSVHQNQGPLLSFLDGINDPANQTRLKKEYRLTNKTYLTLMRIAVGNMFAESQIEAFPLYRHPIYLIKERFPWAVSVKKKFDDGSKIDYRTYTNAYRGTKAGLKLEKSAIIDRSIDAPLKADSLFDLTDNSRGPSQIKYLPPGFEKIFPHINKNNLRVPQYASVATIAYLADAITTLARIAKNHGCSIPRDYFLYHLIYIYTGKASEIKDCEATLDQNLYWRRALGIQKDLETYLLTPKKPQLSAEQTQRIEDIRTEIAGRARLIPIIQELIRILEAKRSRELILKPEHANALIEYSLAAGLITGTHVALKRYQSPKAVWASKTTCRRLLLGRKRYFPILHSINGALIYALRSNRSYDLISLDADKVDIHQLQSSLREEQSIIKRLHLDISLIETGL